MKKLTFLAFALLLIVISSCDPEVDDKLELGDKPTASFDIIAGSTPNDFTLINTTDGAFITQWEIESFGVFEGETVDVSIPLRGDYNVTMTTFNSGGSDSSTSTITVASDDPNGCFGNFELLTGCDEKVWKIAAEEAALHVGPNLVDNYWVNSASDVNDRACQFDDLYTFRSNGEFEFNNNGDFWADTDGDGNIWPPDLALNVGCNDATSWPTKYEAWSSGLHSFNITNQTLTVAGEGAHLALYKIGTNAEVMTPQSSVTFQINELTEDRMVLFVDHSGVFWKLTFVSE